MTSQPMTRREALAMISLMAGSALTIHAAPAAAQGMDHTGDTTRFVRLAAGASELGIEAGRLAMQRSDNVAVHGFAGRMTRDHAKLLNSLRSASDTNVSAMLPHGLGDEGEQMIDRLNAASDAGFNALYMDMQVRSLQDIVVLYQEYSRTGPVENLKKHSLKYTPILEEHARVARTIRGGLRILA